MALSIDMTRAVKFTMDRWNKEAAGYFCRLARKGASFTNVVYPTGLKMVRAQFGDEHVEVELSAAKKLRADGFKVVG